jgi:ABC-2 type transport system ATP-binding protein
MLLPLPGYRSEGVDVAQAATGDRTGRIEVEHISKRFGAVSAVSDLSFAVTPGSVTGFLGPNGSGKTTTLRMILGLINPDAGRASINGVCYSELGTPARVVGAVLEAQGFHPKRTARNHLRVFATAIDVPERRAEELLALVGLAEAGDRKVGGFSLGMRQRLALATALLGDPGVLVLDEPANGLDPEGIAWLRTFLRTFAQSGRTVLVSSHLLAELEQTVDDVVIIAAGRTVYYGPLANLRAAEHSRVFVTPADPGVLVSALREAGITDLQSAPDGRLVVGGADARRIGDVAARAGVATYGMVSEERDLERIYFQLTAEGAQPPPGPPSASCQQPGDEEYWGRR